MHRLVNIANEVNEYFQGECLVGSGILIVEYCSLLVDGSDHIAGVEKRSILESFIGINIFIVPCLGVCILRGVRGVVKPVGVIYD